jgi:hypothetical protein
MQASSKDTHFRARRAQQMREPTFNCAAGDIVDRIQPELDRNDRTVCWRSQNRRVNKKFRLTILALAATLSYGQPVIAQQGVGGLSQHRLCGRYSFSFSGFVSNSFPSLEGYVSGVGQFTSDCRGGLTGIETENLNGAICKYTVDGTYEINRDGTGEDALTATPIGGPCSSPVSFAQSIAVADKGRIVKVISGTTERGTNQVTINQEWVRQ